MAPSHRLKDIFLQAIDAAPGEDRDALILELCGDDVSLRQRLETLLAAHDAPTPHLDRPAARFGYDPTVTDEKQPSEMTESSSKHGQFLPGTKVAGRYRMVSLLGRGGMGEVYRADDLRLDQTVALKFLPADLAGDSKRLTYFHNEVRLARQISHPNVCRVYDIGEVNGQTFISMEYIDGEDLKTLLHRIGRLPKDKGVQIAQQLCAGLSAAHARGVLHRDLKPANIMLDGQGQVRITDFGLATLSGDGADVVGMSGTPAYMAPEQLLRAQTNVQTDIYSLGLILFEVFTGRSAHNVSTVEELRRFHEDSSSTEQPSQVIDDMDPAIDRVITRCLQTDPLSRPRSVAMVAGQLPGADPLAAAVAAGETPSPELVAAAETNAPFSPAIGFMAFAAVVTGLIVVAVSQKHVNLLEQFNDVQPPIVLKSKAREIVEELGGLSGATDDAHGLQLPIYVRDTQEYSVSADSTGFLTGVWYWYRSSPEILRSMLPLESAARVTEAAPGWDTPGMSGLRLDLSGKLRWFRRMPERRESPPGEFQTARWTEWFHADVIGFDLAALTPGDSRFSPPDPFDLIQTWTGRVDSLGDVEVTAAAYDGRPTWFSVSPTNIRKGGDVTDQMHVAFSAVRVATSILAFLLGWWNLKAGRGDRKGAWTISAFIFGTELLSWLFLSHHTASDHELTVYWLALANASMDALLAAVLYLAVEPLIRKIWPETLITWTRLLRGHWTDPRVSRDILLGIALGVWVSVIQLAHQWYFGVYSGGERPLMKSMLGGRYLLGNIADVIGHGTMIAIGGLLLLVAFELLLRSRKLAAVAWVVLCTVFLGIMTGLPETGWLTRGSLPLVVTLYFYSRFGLTSVAALQITRFLMMTPITTNSSLFFFEPGLIVGTVILSLAGVALRNALARNPHYQPTLALPGAD